jgi:SAM-dependent methyltransferase
VSDAEVRDDYEKFPYTSALQHQAHPRHLATMAWLRGIETASPLRCRVLELGCADGGNLIAIAAGLPDSTFVGIDLAPSQIESGKARVAELELKNVDLRAASILDLDASLGTFDFILCHGVFSWVEHHVQEKILDLCRDLLAPNGVAYVSYNTYPGWHFRGMLRDLVRFHARGVEDPAECVRRSLELIRFFSDATGDSRDHHYALYLRSAREYFETFLHPHYFVHEFFERTNEPLYFRDFMARAAAHGLRYVCEADADSADVEHLPPNVSDTLRGFTGDRVELEQYVDFMIDRTFRRTLLTHANVEVRHPLDTQRIRKLWVASPSKPVTANPSLNDGISEGFKTERGRNFSSSHGATKRALVALAGVWPESLSFDDLHHRIGNDVEDLPEMLEALFATGVVELDLVPPVVVAQVSTRPRASRLARWEASHGLYVTTQRGRVLQLDDEVARFLLTQLDGSRDRQALLQALDREVMMGRIEVPNRSPLALQATIEHHLKRHAEVGVLVK